VPADRLRAGVEVLQSRYRVRVTPGVLQRDGYLAGSDEHRAAELNGLLADPEVRAIVVARGGYGLMRILPQLDASALSRDPKLIVGFSDATALLCWAQRCAGVRCLHGPVVTQLGELSPKDVRWLFRMMEDPAPAGVLDMGLTAMGAPGAAAIEGRLMGGNLCLLSHLLGTPYSPDFAGAVLLIEDVGERPYRVDRYLSHLGLAGALSEVRAALVGELTDCVETANDDHPTAPAVVDERLRAYGVPGLGGVPLAHGRRNLALPLGGRCVVDQGRGELCLLEAAVA
jgi:muramoyltetrapeptide carboxypeptidase